MIENAYANLGWMEMDINKKPTKTKKRLQPSKEELMHFFVLVFEFAKSLQKNTITFEVPTNKVLLDFFAKT
jgi:hypothetical protein